MRRSTFSGSALGVAVLNSSESRQTVLGIIERQQNLDGRFEDLRRISPEGGGGAFSVLVSAHDRTTNCRVAIKFFDPMIRFTSDQYRWKSFQREVATLKKFAGQPDILQAVSDMGEFSEPFMSSGLVLPVPFAYYATELAVSDAGRALASGSWKPADKLRTFRVMCRAVQRIHSHGTVHRDLKPTNFLIMADGTLRLSDFGTARCLWDCSPGIEETYTAPPGDLRYTAPELIASLHDVDAGFAFRADFYALGAILFEMFSGSQLNVHLFDNSTISALNSTMNVVNRPDRRRIYEQFVGEMAAARPLPSLGVFGSDVPGSILPLVDRLYMGLSAIDYRVRLVDFATIFSSVNRCVIILDHERAYREWRRRRQTVREAQRKRREHSASRDFLPDRSLPC